MPRAVLLVPLCVLATCLWACPGPPHRGEDTRERDDTREVGVEDEVGPADADAEAPDIDVTVAACPPGARAGACDDGNPCTDDGCTSAGECRHVPNIALCDDGIACTVLDRCSGGRCVGSPMDCDDGAACTEDACRDGRCEHSPVIGACDDGDLCTAEDRCEGGVCSGTPVECPGEGPCQEATCEPRTGCGLVALEDGVVCDDGNACTEGTLCRDGQCVGALADCGDGDPCSDDYCDPAGGCGHRPNHAPCDDGDRCTTGDRCDLDVCRGTRAEPCCTDDAACDDGDPCSDDACLGASCAHTPRACGDDDRCTRDACEGGACVHVAWLPLPPEGQVIEDFEGGPEALDGWTFASSNEAVAWRIDGSWAASGQGSLYCGAEDAYSYDRGATRASALTRLLVPPADAELHFVARTDVAELGSCIYDVLQVTIDGAVIGLVCGSGEGERSFSLSAYEGREVELGLVFDTIDGLDNDGQGIWIDRLRLTAAACR